MNLNTTPASATAVLTAASQTDYLLSIQPGGRRTLVLGWLLLGLFALAGAGLYSVLLVLSRTPAINEWFPVVDFFRVALVVHVDLSVLVWFVALAGMLWSPNNRSVALRVGDRKSVVGGRDG